MEEVKIIYCYDENSNTIHYTKIERGGKYFCIDCGAELICRDGNNNIKHLSHKNSANCGGTGESILHKYWKENLINVGDTIELKNNREVIEAKCIDRRVEFRFNTSYGLYIPDLIIKTDQKKYQFIIFEICYKNPKTIEDYIEKWIELDYLVYEVNIEGLSKDMDNKYINNLELLYSNVKLLYSKSNKKEILEDIVNLKFKKFDYKFNYFQRNFNNETRKLEGEKYLKYEDLTKTQKDLVDFGLLKIEDIKTVHVHGVYDDEIEFISKLRDELWHTLINLKISSHSPL